MDASYHWFATRMGDFFIRRTDSVWTVEFNHVRIGGSYVSPEAAIQALSDPESSGSITAELVARAGLPANLDDWRVLGART